ncbi:hypothetical protein MMC24_001375 [Lignoscripta atroalba]|nr:hypothetical protein [Lignoscripta atroalba]
MSTPTPAPDPSLSLSLGLENTHVLITGSSGFLGSATVAAFLAAGSLVTALDVHPSTSKLPPHLASHANLFVLPPCDITSESALEHAFAAARAHHRVVVSCCVALASLDLSVLQHHASLLTMGVEQWRRTFAVNVEGTFLTARTWLREVERWGREGGGGGRGGGGGERIRNVGLIVVGSESGREGERGNADYAAAKSAVQVGLVQSLKGDVARVWDGARVNAIAPGPVDTPQFRKECKTNPEQLWLDAQATTALGKPVPMNAVAKSILYLASEAWSGHVTGQVLNVDSGKQGKVMWTKEEL